MLERVKEYRDSIEEGKITLSFTPEMEQAILNGKKHCTTRRTKHGEKGDIFQVSGNLYQLVEFYPVPLRAAVQVAYIDEGFNSQDEFKVFWEKNIEPYNGDKQVWVHFFKPVQEDDA